jgi:hypothetical protein
MVNKTVTIHCEHRAAGIRLNLVESNICCIQCGLIQVVLSRSQATRVRRYCHCMLSKLREGQDNRGRAVMTIDPSQLDLRGQPIASWLRRNSAVVD